VLGGRRGDCSGAGSEPAAHHADVIRLQPGRRGGRRRSAVARVVRASAVFRAVFSLIDENKHVLPRQARDRQNVLRKESFENGGVRIITLVSRNASLRSLDLEGNDVTAATASALGEVPAVSYSIRILRFCQDKLQIVLTGWLWIYLCIWIYL
jgi:hypothetical protein